MPQPTGYIVLSIVWGGAVLGVALKLLWPHAPRWLGTPIYIALGWVAVFVLPDLLHHAGVAALVLLLVGGAFYTLGAVFYATRWPNPWPRSSATTSSSTRPPCWPRCPTTSRSGWPCTPSCGFVGLIMAQAVSRPSQAVPPSLDQIAPSESINCNTFEFGFGEKFHAIKGDVSGKSSFLEADRTLE